MHYGLNGSAPSKPSTAALLLAYAIVYIVWGSTYLAIRFAIETLPPLMMTGARFLVVRRTSWVESLPTW